MMITKVANFKGFYFTCSKCGREIKHAYTLNNGKDVYGKECLTTKIYGKNIKKEIKKADGRMATLEHIKRFAESQYKEMCENFGGEKEMIRLYLKGTIA